MPIQSTDPACAPGPRVTALLKKISIKTRSDSSLQNNLDTSLQSDLAGKSITATTRDLIAAAASLTRLTGGRVVADPYYRPHTVFFLVIGDDCHEVAWGWDAAVEVCRRYGGTPAHEWHRLGNFWTRSPGLFPVSEAE